MGFIGGQHLTTPTPILPPITPILDQEVLKIHENINNPVFALNVCKSPKFPRLIGIRVEEHDGDIRF